ncbi:MAG: hypothetical protein KA104_00285 [Candidatus Pacebacteria bacterium]|nr:hypothetical protein [Candidatus Paceibacterota bacterium]
MNLEKPWDAGERKSNVINLAEERAKREKAHEEAQVNLDAEVLDHFDFSVLPPINAEEFNDLPPFNLPRNES